jgi:hypothetical protein
MRDEIMLTLEPRPTPRSSDDGALESKAPDREQDDDNEDYMVKRGTTIFTIGRLSPSRGHREGYQRFD